MRDWCAVLLVSLLVSCGGSSPVDLPPPEAPAVAVVPPPAPADPPPTPELPVLALADSATTVLGIRAEPGAEPIVARCEDGTALPTTRYRDDYEYNGGCNAAVTGKAFYTTDAHVAGTNPLTIPDNTAAWVCQHGQDRYPKIDGERVYCPGAAEDVWALVLTGTATPGQARPRQAPAIVEPPPAPDPPVTRSDPEPPPDTYTPPTGPTAMFECRGGRSLGQHKRLRYAGQCHSGSGQYYTLDGGRRGNSSVGLTAANYADGFVWICQNDGTTTTETRSNGDTVTQYCAGNDQWELVVVGSLGGAG